MAAASPNRVRALREARGLSQIALAERARLTRQSVGAIEAGRAVPAVDVALRLARALGCRVEDLFGEPEVERTLEVELAGEPRSPRVALTRVRGRDVAVPLDGPDGLRTGADALVVRARGRRATVTLLQPERAGTDSVVLMGCAVGLGLVADRLAARRGLDRALWLPSSSAAALRALAAGTTHLAGVHAATPPGAAADANVELCRRLGPREPLVLVTLARWEAGLLTRADETRVRTAADLAAPGVRLVVREPGAGARALLETHLGAAGAPATRLSDASLVATGHLDVARAIAMGAADAGIATRDAAVALGLRFTALAEERYDLVIPRALLPDARVERLLDVLVSRGGRSDLASLGYDVSGTGERVADVSAA